MSSPGGFQGNAAWLPPMAQPSLHATTNDSEEDGVTIKPMRLKVLYTFDDQNKTNCLARWPQILHIRTVVMDEGTSIGVIELKTCIQAIVQCSPELVAKLGQDYTVYAYDYSEYDNPLVGQGMLSWALAAASSTPNSPAHPSHQFITGRVCKNIQGLFATGVAETLEVKLRLLPVPTVLQSDYLASMERYRELSRVTPAGSNSNERQSFIQSNSGLTQMAKNVNAPTLVTSSQRDGVSMEVFNQLLSPQLQQHEFVDPFNNAISNESGAESRNTHPMGGEKLAQKNPRSSSRTSTKRPRKSRAKSTMNGGNTSGYEEGTDGDEAPAPKKRAKVMQTDWNSKSGFGTASDSLRVAASTAGSLRAFRPIAAAVSNMVGSPGSHLQEMPRAPTPVPGGPSQIPGFNRGRSQSALRRDSTASQVIDARPSQYQSPYQNELGADSQDMIQPSIESALTSPEKYDSAADTPPDIGSSPPVLRTTTSLRSSPQVPSSPVLPKMPRTDSGFMSGDVSELFDDEEDLTLFNDEDINIASQNAPGHPAHLSAIAAPVHWQTVNPGPPELLPTKILPRYESLRPKADPRPKTKLKASKPRPSRARGGSAVSETNAGEDTIQGIPVADTQSLLRQRPLNTDDWQSPANTPLLPDLELQQQVLNEAQPRPTALSAAPVVRPGNRPLSRTASVGSLTLPTVTASDPVLPPTSLYRSQTWSDAPYPPTDAPCPPTDAPTPRETARGATAGTIAKKLAQRTRLESAIAKGEMPPFCNNCGAIETPTWRRGFAQEHKGDPGYHEYSDAPGRVTAIEILERDEEGKPMSYRIFKKSLLPGEDREAFAEVLLCNPCGIWMAKYKTMRPENKWNQDLRNPQPIEKRPLEKKSRDRSKSKNTKETQASHPVHLTSEAHFQSDVFGTIDYGLAQDAPGFRQSQEAFGIPQTAPAEAQEEPQLPPQRHVRASSMRPGRRSKPMTSGAASGALRRAIQSSPARWLGTQHSPIELEEDMGTTRRLLFPSPRKEGSGGLCEIAGNVAQPVLGVHSLMARRKHSVASTDKENCPPIPQFDDADNDISKLFEYDVGRLSRPTTPVQKSSPSDLLNTPMRPTPGHRPITRSVSKSAKSIRMEMRPQRTPSKTPRSSAARRRSPRNHAGIFESPFTATLNRLMSDAHDDETHNIHNDSPSRDLDLGLDFSNLPDLGHSGSNGMHSDTLNFNFPYDGNHDFFSTDVPMPSSPPRAFHVYEDPLAMSMTGLENIDHMWNDFPIDESTLQSLGTGLHVDANGHATFSAGINSSSKVKIEAATPNIFQETRHAEESQTT